VLKGSLKPSILSEGAAEELRPVTNGDVTPSDGACSNTPDLLSDSDVQSPVVNGSDHDLERGRSREKKLLNGSPRSEEKAKELARLNVQPIVRKPRSRDPSPIQRMAEMLRSSFTVKY
jgi:hypothetical protein